MAHWGLEQPCEWHACGTRATNHDARRRAGEFDEHNRGKAGSVFRSDERLRLPNTYTGVVAAAAFAVGRSGLARVVEECFNVSRELGMVLEEEPVR
jgi:hypothetical protein